MRGIEEMQGKGIPINYILCDANKSNGDGQRVYHYKILDATV